MTARQYTQFHFFPRANARESRRNKDDLGRVTLTKCRLLPQKATNDVLLDMSIVLYGQKIDVPNTACFLDDADVVRTVTRGRATKIPRSTEGYARDPESFWIRGHVTHTTSGTVRALDAKPLIESVKDWIFAKYSTNADEKSWSLTSDLDGSAIQVSDPSRVGTWHAGQVNSHTDGWELTQTEAGTLTQSQLDSYVRLCDEWSYHCGIPRVIPWRDGQPFRGMLTRALSVHGAGASLCLFYGHRNIWSLNKTTGKLQAQRGPGDPSDLPFLALKAAGYMALDVEAGEDLSMWKVLQAQLGLDADGVPGPATRAALIRSGRFGTGGMLVPRPGDDTRGVPAWIRARPVAWRQANGLT